MDQVCTVEQKGNNWIKISGIGLKFQNLTSYTSPQHCGPVDTLVTPLVMCIRYKRIWQQSSTEWRYDIDW